jgi:hypothetical protein
MASLATSIGKIQDTNVFLEEKIQNNDKFSATFNLSVSFYTILIKIAFEFRYIALLGEVRNE